MLSMDKQQRPPETRGIDTPHSTRGYTQRVVVAIAQRSIEPMAWAGNEDGYLQKIRLSWDENCATGRGPGGRTIRSGETVVCRDITVESAFFHWLNEATGRGYRSAFVVDGYLGEKLPGTTHRSRPGMFDRFRLPRSRVSSER